MLCKLSSKGKVVVPLPSLPQAYKVVRGTMWDAENGVLLEEGWEFDRLDSGAPGVAGSGWDKTAKTWAE
ncbi:hypothetical protein E2C01_015590 [Portunus trituberculatus]|uniref:Uncharacterized protein n=1 Tax=Portunus trituberculatus TaxID=210409 RepID=A0A5B7DNG0_PORTR|nr:hypothetical protein [Portunus trituberculatus]